MLKLPLGVMPRFIFYEGRMRDLSRAIEETLWLVECPTTQDWKRIEDWATELAQTASMMRGVGSRQRDDPLAKGRKLDEGG